MVMGEATCATGTGSGLMGLQRGAQGCVGDAGSSDPHPVPAAGLMSRKEAVWPSVRGGHRAGCLMGSKRRRPPETAPRVAACSGLATGAQ